MFDYLSNLYINFYYGSYIKLDENWGEKNVICPFSKIYYMMDGSCEIIIEDKKHTASTGDIFLIPSGIKHSFYHTNHNYITKYWFHFDLKAGGSSFFDIVNVPYYFHIGKKEEIIQLFQKIINSAADNSLSAQLNLNSKILELISIYCSITNSDITLTYDDINMNFKAVLDYINDNLNKNITIHELANILHFHPNYFVRYFKERIGVPPVKYINHLKIGLAKSLLETTTIPVKEIMSRIGFDDYSHFSKFFKTYCGYSPTAFRNNYCKL